MNLSEHINYCQNILEKHGDIKCIYSSDDEGNSYSDSVFVPSVGVYVGSRDGDYCTEENWDERQEDERLEDRTTFIPNAICIN